MNNLILITNLDVRHNDVRNLEEIRLKEVCKIILKFSNFAVERVY